MNPSQKRNKLKLLKKCIVIEVKAAEDDNKKWSQTLANVKEERLKEEAASFKKFVVGSKSLELAQKGRFFAQEINAQIESNE